MRLIQKYFWINLPVFTVLFVITVLGCKKEDPAQPPNLSTLPVTEIATTRAKSGGNVTDDGGAPVKERGVVWSTTNNPAIDNNEGKTADGEGTGDYSSTLDDLSPGLQYFVRAYSTNVTGTSYGLQVEFTTSVEFATVTTAEVTDITSSSATSGGNVNGDGGSPVTARGIVWSTTENPAVDNNEGKTTDGEGVGEYSSTLDGLSPGMKYFVRAYATNGAGTSYGLQVEFTTSVEFATVTTAEVTEITSSSATSGGNVIDDGGSPVIARGVVWSTAENPAVDNNEGKTTDGEGAGEYSSSLIGLSPGLRYYVRAYATNATGTTYGLQVEFTASVELATVTTAEVTGITSSSATSGGNVTGDGGSPVTVRGVVWSTAENPGVDNNEGKTTDGEGSGEYSSSLIGLSPGLKYFVSAYATNGAGTSYGLQVEFTASVELATVTTEEVTEITSSSATSGGNVIDDGGSPVTAHGVVWSTTENPAVDNNEGKTTDGEGSGEYSSSLIGLSPGVKYYVRAYATNGAGTSYGLQVEFTSSADLATVTTEEVTGITSSTATSGGTVIDDGGSPVTVSGIVWSRTENPTVESNEGSKTDGTGTGEFTSTLSGLSSEITYYVRAYATNSIGTAYGNQIAFETLPEEDDRPGPLFVFGFDDANDSDYYYAYTELKSRGFRGTSFVHTINIGNENALTWDMIHEMVNDGWEMGCHTHSHFRLTDAGDNAQLIRDELEMVNSLYQLQGLPTPKHHTYPYGANNEFVRSIVSEYRLSGRTTTIFDNNFDKEDFDFMMYRWTHADMYNTSELVKMKEQVDLAFQEKTVLVSFLIHRLVLSNPVGYSCLLANFQELLDYIVLKGGTVVTMNEAYEIISGYRQSVNLE